MEKKKGKLTCAQNTGNAAYYTIPKERREFIRNRLKECSCSPAMGGYNVLFHVISIAADVPEYSCKELFLEYARHVSGGKERGWRTPYNLANYCFNNAVTNARSLFAFIKEAAMELLEKEEALFTAVREGREAV